MRKRQNKAKGGKREKRGQRRQKEANGCTRK